MPLFPSCPTGHPSHPTANIEFSYIVFIPFDVCKKNDEKESRGDFQMGVESNHPWQMQKNMPWGIRLNIFGGFPKVVD